LIELYDRLLYEKGQGREYMPIKIMTPGGERFDVLSVNWDADAEEWVIIGDDYDDDGT
jgi:hypothetical protein